MTIPTRKIGLRAVAGLLLALGLIAHAAGAQSGPPPGKVPPQLPSQASDKARAAVAAHTAPAVGLIAPVAGALYNALATVLLEATASASSSGKSILQVEFFADAALIGTASSAPYAFTWAPVAEGAYSLTARATDNLGVTATSSAVAITVSAVPPTVVSLLPVTASVTLGASTSLTLTISAAQTTDTVVPLAANPPGIVAVPAAVSVPAGQTGAAVPVTALALGQAGVTAALNGTTASSLVNVVPPPVAVTALEPPTHIMTVGATSTFTVRINAAQLANTEIALSVDNPAVLQVPAAVTVVQGTTSATFTATALATGNALVTAGANNTAASAAVHVSPQPASIVSLLPNPLPLQRGSVGSFTVTIDVAQEADTVVGITNTAPAIIQVPAGVTVAAGAMSATVSVTALAAGLAEVTAVVNGTSASSQVEVTPPPPMVTAIDPATLTLPKGLPGILRVVVSRAPNVATAVSLASSNPAVAQVPATVNVAAGSLYAEFPVAALTEGQATITASLNGDAASAVVTVTAAELVALTLSPDSALANVGEAVTFTARGTMTDGTEQDFTTRVTWSSSNETVASIAPGGVASALVSGQTTITAAYSYNAAQSGQAVTVAFSTTLTVNAAPSVSLTSPANNAILPAPATITLTATAQDLDGGVARVEFFQGAILLATLKSPPYTHVLANLAAGSYTFTARATDNRGVATTSAAVTVIVNALPTVGITSPANGATFTAPASIIITANASDADGTITRVDFYVNGNLTGVAAVSPYSFTLENLAQGSYSLTARVTDNLGGTATSEPITVTVNPAVAQLYFIHTDHLNTPRLITNQTGQAIWRWANDDPFGNNAPNENPSGLGNFTCNLRLPGQYFDRETSTHYNYFRDYDPAIGRYVQSDPIGLEGGINMYAYGENSPVLWLDPNGLKTYRCTKPLDALTKKFGTETSKFAYKYLPYMYHQYSCVVRDGKTTCGGQDFEKSPIYGPGKPSIDTFKADRCKETKPDNDCFERCLVSEWGKPRPNYGIPIGSDCQNYDNDVSKRCAEKCQIRK